MLGWVRFLAVSLALIVFSSCTPCPWIEMDSGTSEYLLGVWADSASDVFAVGDHGTIIHYDGSKWTSMESGTQNMRIYPVERI